VNYLDEQFLTVNSVEGGAWLLVVVRSILGIISTINILGACATIDHGSKSATQVVSALLLNNLLKHDNIRVH